MIPLLLFVLFIVFVGVKSLSNLGDSLLPDASAIICTLTDVLRKLVLKVFEMLIFRWLVLIQDTLYMLRTELLLALELMRI